MCADGVVGGVRGARQSNVKGESNVASGKSKRVSVREMQGYVVRVGGRVVGARVVFEAVGAFGDVCLPRRVVVV